MLGYKHTLAQIKNFKLRFNTKSNQPLFGKKHDNFAVSKISKPGELRKNSFYRN